jgi:hypothetical protein
MIEGVVGFPGAGKTYYALNRARKEMTKKTKEWPNGRPVYSNFSIQGAKKITPETIFDIEPGAFVVIDEAQNWFGSRNWQQFGNAYMEFFSQTRKKQYTLLWISQDVSSVDKTIRDRTHLIYEMKSYLSGIFGNPLFFTATCYYGAKNIGKEKYNAGISWIRFKKEIAESYDTHEVIKSRELKSADKK